MDREIEVWADWWGLGGATFMGTLCSLGTRGKEVFSFEYDNAWLEGGFFPTLDPDLRFYEGRQYLDLEDRPNFGLFLDSSPDRWGRLLMRRREAVRAREEERPERRLQEIDYLLGVHDEQRVGALRFKDREAGSSWLSDDPSMITPPLASLRELEHACWKLQGDDVKEDPNYLLWLKLMMAPGSSLGGARPKAGVHDETGDLWIAKFPARSDTRDMGAWEVVAQRLALAAGISMADARLEHFGGQHGTYMTRRFDRAEGSEGRGRIHFASAMTLLGYSDGANHVVGVSYLELVELIIRQGADPNADLEELWRRIVFSIAIRNTDDHLRNHGFLLTPAGWKLSPAYDINPDPDGAGLSLNISETNNSLSFELVLNVAPYFRLESKRARRILAEVRGAVSGWRKVAEDCGIARFEQDAMEIAFQLGL